MSERVEKVLALLADNPRGITIEQMRGELGLGPKPMTRVLAWLKSQKQADAVQVGKRLLWASADNLATLMQMRAESQEAARQKHLRDNKLRKRRRRVEKTRPGPVRVWSDGESSWTPPGPLIPSVWHLPRVLGLA